VGRLITQEEIVKELRKHYSEKIVFTNGCFDIIHIGHIRLLKRCWELGDIVVVGLNSDKSVFRLKGEGRPIMKQNERAEILSSLFMVDYVVIFDEDDPVNLIRFIKPHILVKGSDYSIDEVLGRKEVESWGGSVELFPLIKGVSTTDIISKIKSIS